VFTTTKSSLSQDFNASHNSRKTFDVYHRGKERKKERKKEGGGGGGKKRRKEGMQMRYRYVCMEGERKTDRQEEGTKERINTS
jgi:hypothetical protein